MFPGTLKEVSGVPERSSEVSSTTQRVSGVSTRCFRYLITNVIGLLALKFWGKGRSAKGPQRVYKGKPDQISAAPATGFQGQKRVPCRDYKKPLERFRKPEWFQRASSVLRSGEGEGLLVACSRPQFSLGRGE